MKILLMYTFFNYSQLENEVSQLEPVEFELHAHPYPLEPTLKHVPPLTHGFARHGFSLKYKSSFIHYNLSFPFYIFILVSQKSPE